MPKHPPRPPITTTVRTHRPAYVEWKRSDGAYLSLTPAEADGMVRISSCDAASFGRGYISLAISHNDLDALVGHYYKLHAEKKNG